MTHEVIADGWRVLRYFSNGYRTDVANAWKQMPLKCDKSSFWGSCYHGSHGQNDVVEIAGQRDFSENQHSLGKR